MNRKLITEILLGVLVCSIFYLIHRVYGESELTTWAGFFLLVIYIFISPKVVAWIGCHKNEDDEDEDEDDPTAL